MLRLEMKNYSMILIGKQLKYQFYHEVKFGKSFSKTNENDVPSNGCKGNIANVKFDEFDNALEILDII